MLRKIFTEHRAVFIFLGRFFGVYIGLSLLYLTYIALTTGQQAIDPLTALVGEQSQTIINGWGYEAKVLASGGTPELQLFVNGDLVARIIEGCNAVSIIILFVSFVFAFKKAFKKTLLFVFGGAVLIYGINLVRIAILAIALYHYPEKEPLLHQVVFPALIYGLVALLWMLWVGVFKKRRFYE